LQKEKNSNEIFGYSGRGIENLRLALKLLAQKIEPKVYEYEFLKE
jgi:hypothetical protein